MPLYDYHCTKCQQDFELLVRASTVPTCPHCASTALERRLSLTAPPGTSAAIIAAARKGHFSNYSRADQAKARK